MSDNMQILDRKELGLLIDTLASAIEDPDAGWRCEFRGSEVEPIELPLILANAIQLSRAEITALRAEVERLKEPLSAIVGQYNARNPMRTADVHDDCCHCMRCEVDRAEAALTSLNDREGG